jgi:hypothetical protein
MMLTITMKVERMNQIANESIIVFLSVDVCLLDLYTLYQLKCSNNIRKKNSGADKCCFNYIHDNREKCRLLYVLTEKS